MGLLPNDDAVLIQKGKKPGEPCVITVNCPDNTGLACDICRTILDFGLFITKGDVSTDGKWCYILLWVVPHSSSCLVHWSSLKERLLSVCPPPFSLPFYQHQQRNLCKSQALYLLTFCCLDRRGLLHDVTHVLMELELSIENLKVTTTPDGRVLDLLFITDNMDLLHKKERQEETCKKLRHVLGDSCLSCELSLADSHHQIRLGVSPPSFVSEELFRTVYSEKEWNLQALTPELSRLEKANVNVDNTLCPSHTLLQIQCVDHKGLLYDILRTVKDHDIQIAYGRFSEVTKGERVIDLFVHWKDGRKIVDPEDVFHLCSHLKMEMLHPLHVMVVERGPDTELLVANPVELSKKGRPLVFYDVTRALKALGICIFSAEIGRHSLSEREWDVYRFLLDEDSDFPIMSSAARNQIVNENKSVAVLRPLQNTDQETWKWESVRDIKLYNLSLLGRFFSLGRGFRLLGSLLCSLLGQQNRVNVGKNSTMGDGHTIQKLSELLIVPHSNQVLKDGGHVNRSSSSDALSVPAFFQVPADTTDGELKTGFDGAGDGLLPRTTAPSSGGSLLSLGSCIHFWFGGKDGGNLKSE
ncbi:hypothetical protein V2J09_019063 [Rumex salicifolius]